MSDKLLADETSEVNISVQKKKKKKKKANLLLIQSEFQEEPDVESIDWEAINRKNNKKVI